MSEGALFEVHDGRHTDCPPCYAIKLNSIQFQNIGAQGRRQSDHSAGLDMDDYKSLRRQGYQPRHVFGTHEIAQKAETTFELEHSVVMAPSIRKEMESRMIEAKGVLSA